MDCKKRNVYEVAYIDEECPRFKELLEEGYEFFKPNKEKNTICVRLPAGWRMELLAFVWTSGHEFLIIDDNEQISRTILGAKYVSEAPKSSFLMKAAVIEDPDFSSSSLSFVKEDVNYVEGEGEWDWMNAKWMPFSGKMDLAMVTIIDTVSGRKKKGDKFVD